MTAIIGLPREQGQEKDRKFIEALARGLDVLRTFQQGDGFLGNQEIAQRTGLPKSSVSRLTYTLTQLGYLSYSERLEKYQLGSGVLALGYAFVSNLAVRRIAKPQMQELANSTGTAVGLADRDRLEMIYLEHCAPTDVTTFRHEIGDKVDIARTSSGRAYLASLPAAERQYFERYIREKTEKKSTDKWPQVKSGIDAAVRQLEKFGYCSSFGDWDRDVNGVAVPLVLGQKHIYVFNAGGPAYRVSPEYLQREVAPLLKNMVRDIEATLIHY